jgi:glycosyltransferase involved in cell wall biosynthesis
METIFIGGLYPNERLDEIKKNTKHIDFPANTFQWALLNGFKANSYPIKVITLPTLRDFPQYYKKTYFKSSSFSHIKGNEDLCLGFVTFPLIKHVSKYLNLYNSLKNLLKDKDNVHLIIYGIHSPYLKAVEKIKQRNDKIKTCLIVPDLPEYMSDSKNKIYRLLKSIDKKIIFKSFQYIDSFVLLSRYMTERLPIGDKPWMVMEGIYNTNDNVTNVPKEPYKTILYTGNLGKRYGILDLLEAFTKISNPNFRLWLCGNGDGLEKIQEIQKRDHRIEYFGILPRNEVLKLQKRATLLVNPRHSYEEYTKYSFPSKTMEYVASGTPTLMNKLPCLPKEYEPYIYFFDDESIEGMKHKIIEICEKNHEELNEFGKKAAEFIHTQKSPYYQCKKIADFINSVL